MSATDCAIFIVDDDPAVCRALARLLTAAGHSTHTFGSAHAFLDAHAAVGAGCLLLDVQLPDLNGLDLFRELQRAGTFMPVIFMTGYGDIPMSVRAARKRGCVRNASSHMSSCAVTSL